MDAAEPAVASAPDGHVFVAWVEHRENKEAVVMLARVYSEGRMQDAPVRVNPQPGEATAWRGDPPTVKVAADVPEAERVHLEVLRTESPTYQAVLDAQRRQALIQELGGE